MAENLYDRLSWALESATTAIHQQSHRRQGAPICIEDCYFGQCPANVTLIRQANARRDAELSLARDRP